MRHRRAATGKKEPDESARLLASSSGSAEFVASAQTMLVACRALTVRIRGSS
jgi:hypothetical protein